MGEAGTLVSTPSPLSLSVYVVGEVRDEVVEM